MTQIVEHTMEPLVISTSGVSDYRRCRKKYEISYVMNRDVESNEAAQLGTEFHALLAAVGNNDRAYLDNHKSDAMYPIAREYLKHMGFEGHTAAVEEPFYTLVLNEDRHDPQTGLVLPAVYVRSTFDRVFVDEDKWIVARDYKTFTQKPVLDVDLDFQGRMYIGALMKRFQTDKVRFEYECVRQEIGRELSGGKGKDKVWNEWPTEERYYRIPLSVPGHEIITTWRELRYDLAELRRKLFDPGTVWTRTDLKSGPHGCNGCFQRNLCKSQMQHGTLTDDVLDFFSKPRDPADRMTPLGIVTDPRVLFHSGSAEAAEAAVLHVYGQNGLALARRVLEPTEGVLV